MPLPPLPSRPASVSDASAFSAGDLLFDRFVLLSAAPVADCARRWLATDISTRTTVALEFYPPLANSAPAGLERLQKAALAANQVQHARVARLVDLRSAQDFTAAIWELVEGPTLREVIDQHPDFPQVTAWGGQLAEALDYLHLQLGLAHGALKPSRIVVTAKQGIRVTHFHVLDVLRDLILQSGGTWDSADELPYLSPQRWARAATAPSDDVYAFGAILYALLAGSPPFHEGDIAAQATSTSVPPIFLRRLMAGLPDAGIPMPWEVAIASCLAKQSAERPPALTGLLLAASASSAAPKIVSVEKRPAVPSSLVAPPAAAFPSASPAPVPPAPVIVPGPVASAPPPAVPAEPHANGYQSSLGEVTPAARDNPPAPPAPIPPVPAPAVAPKPTPIVSTPPPAPAPAIEAPPSRPVSPPAAPKAKKADDEPELYPVTSARRQGLGAVYWIVLLVLLGGGGYGGWWVWQDSNKALSQVAVMRQKLDAAEALIAQKQPAEALVILREASALEPGNASIRDRIQLVETQMERQREIARLLEVARLRGSEENETQALEAVAQIRKLDPAHVEAVKLQFELEGARNARALEKQLAAEKAAAAAAAAANALAEKTQAERAAAAAEAAATRRRMQLLELKLTATRLDTAPERAAAREAIAQLRNLDSADADLPKLEARLQDAERPPPPPPAPVVAPPVAAPVAATPAVTTPARNYKKAKLISSVEPTYPRAFLKEGKGGQAEVSVIVSPAGKVTAVEVLNATNADFGRAAADAARKFVFAPATEDDKPVASRVVIPFEFNFK